MASMRAGLADLLLATLLAVLVAAVYAATAFGCIYGNDGAMLADWTALPARAYHHYHNTLYLPAAACLAAVLPRGLVVDAGDPLWLAKSLSIVAGGLGSAFTFACCRLLQASRAGALAGTLLLALSPMAWFFGAAIEVHSLHFAIVSFAALVTLAAPWRRPVLAMALTAAAFVLPYLSHQSAPVLGPGWILLVQCARRRVAAPFAWRTLFGVGVVLLAVLVLGHMLVEWRRGRGFHADFGDVAKTVGVWRQTFTPSIVWNAVVAPLAFVLPIVAIAVARRGVDGWLRATVLAVYVPLTACVLWWGIAERGGYLFGPAALLAMAAAAWWTMLPPRARLLTAVVALVAQAAVGWCTVRAFDTGGARLTDRVARVRENLGSTGLVVSCNDNAPDISIWLPGVRELNFGPTLAQDIPAAQWIEVAQPGLQGLLANERFLLDRSWVRRTDLSARFREAMQRFEAALQPAWRIRELDDASWPMWLCERR